MKKTERISHFANRISENGKHQTEIYQTPINYKDGDEWKEIKLELSEQGDNYLSLENNFTVGFRKDKQLHKYMGIRFEEKQLEYSLDSVLIDGVEQLKDNKFTEINTNKNILCK